MSVPHLEFGVIMRPECVINMWHHPACNVRLSRCGSIFQDPYTFCLSWICCLHFLGCFLSSPNHHTMEWPWAQSFNQYLYSANTHFGSHYQYPRSSVYHLSIIYYHHNLSSICNQLVSTTYFDLCVSTDSQVVYVQTHTHTYIHTLKHIYTFTHQLDSILVVPTINRHFQWEVLIMFQIELQEYSRHLTYTQLPLSM
jgi:hypothetical protein